MSEPTINANIIEIDGAFYPVRLQWLPRVGDLIDLWSFIDQLDRSNPVHHYEVVQVVHKLHDVTNKSDVPKTGHHFVSVYVKPSQDELFNS